MNIYQIGKKTLIPLASALVGGGVVLASLELSPAIRSKLNGDSAQVKRNEQIYDAIFKNQDNIRRQFDTLFADDFSAQREPFDEMKKMRKQMEEQMKSFEDKSHVMSNPFDSWFSDKFGGGTIDDISKREDENFVYYDVKVDDVNSTSINTKVEKGYITIGGTTEKKSNADGKGSGSSQSVFKSSFNRTFPLPENVDEKKLQMLTDKNVITLKFPKLKS